MPVSDGVCLEKVRTFRQWSQSEINNYISTINMYMVWGKEERNQSICLSFSLSVPLFFSSSSVPLCVCWVGKSEAIPLGKTAAVKQNCFSHHSETLGNLGKRTHTEGGRG